MGATSPKEHFRKKIVLLHANKTKTAMPQICSFYGIIIFMNYNDHAPAHFHAWYGEYKVSVNIADGLVKGEMPKRALHLIFEWLELHKDELLSNWNKAKCGRKLDAIEPLK